VSQIRTFLAWTIALFLTLVFGTLAILTSWVPPRGKLYLFWARSWAHAVLFFACIPYRIEVPDETAALPEAIFMSNHESAVDILVLFLAIPQDVRFLAKRSLFYIPFLGWSMALAGFIPVDRERKDRAKEVLHDLVDRLRKGSSVLVFPEGTRSRTGALGTFKKSGFLLALKSGLPIVPIGIQGARAILGADGMRLNPGLVVVRVGTPIPTVGLGVSHRRELMEKVRGEILRLTGRV